MKKTLLALLTVFMLNSSLLHAQTWIPASGGNLITDPATTNVGIGVTAPTDPLTIKNTMSLYDPLDKYRYILGRSLTSGIKMCANTDATEASVTLHATNETGTAAGAVTFMTKYNSNTTYPYVFQYTNQSNAVSNFLTFDPTGIAQIKNSLLVGNSIDVSSTIYGEADLNIQNNGIVYGTFQSGPLSAGSLTSIGSLTSAGPNTLNGTTTLSTTNINGALDVSSTIYGEADLNIQNNGIVYGTFNCGPLTTTGSLTSAGPNTLNGTTTLSTTNINGILGVSSNINASGTITSSALNGTGNRMVKTSSTGTLGYESMPALSISGTTLTLSNGGSINSHVTVPSGGGGGGWVGTATSALNMSSFGINNVSTIQGTFGASLNLNSSNISTTAQMSVGAPSTSGYQFYVDGDTYCTAGVWTASDKRFKKDIQNLSNVSENLFKVIPRSYNFKREEFKGIKNFDAINHFGFIAQEIKEIYPNLVRLDSPGYYAINYTEFIPLLLQSLKEEDAKLKDYENRLADLENEIQEIKYNNITTTAANTAKVDNNKTTLSQNVPNPFNAETVIGFNIAGQFNQAFIGLYDLTGKEIKRMPINSSVNFITIPAGMLQPGMYVYNLVVDGIMVDSKKMVSTN